MAHLTVQYSEDGRVAYFNDLRFLKEEDRGYYKCSKLLDGHRKRLHVVVWEHFNGPKPEGYDIHHIDGDKDNNEIDNLFCITSSEHRRYHYLHMTEEHRQKLIDNNSWQYTEEGRAWHAEVRSAAWEKVEAKEQVCSHCGKTFLSRRSYAEGANRFCGTKCCSAVSNAKKKARKELAKQQKTSAESRELEGASKC